MLRAVQAARLALPLLSCVAAGFASGADWRLSKGLSASAAFTDNADGAVTDEATRAETVLGLAPFVTLTATGQRHELILDGRLELSHFADEDRTTIDPDASLRTRSVLVDRIAELEILARVSQRGVDDNPFNDDEFRTGFGSSREETWELGLVPSFERRLGTRSRVEGEYRFSTVRSSDEDSVGSDTHAVAARLDTVLDASGTFGIVAGDGTRVRFEDGAAAGRTSSIGLGLGRPFGRTAIGALTTGIDRVRVDETSETLDSTFWTVALRWEPNERMLATVGYGERAFGRRPSASLRLNGRRSSVELRWSRELTLGSDAGRGDTFSEPFDGGGTDVPLAEREESVIGNSELLSPFAGEASRVRERVDIGYALTGRRSRLSASVGWFDDERLENDGGASGIGSGGNSHGAELALGFDRTLSSRVDLSSRYRFLTTRSSGASERVRTNLVELVVSVRL